MASQTFQPIHNTDFKDKIEERNPLLGAIFLFLLFLAFVFVYFLYTCTRCRQQASNYSNSNPRNQQNRSSPSLIELDPAMISRLSIFSYGSSTVENNNKTSQQGGECCICLGMFQEGDKVKVLPLCHHGFHSECVDKWLKTRSSCPLCRASILQPQSSTDMEIP